MCRHRACVRRPWRHPLLLGRVPRVWVITKTQSQRGRENRARGQKLAAGPIPSYHQHSTGLAKKDKP